MERNAGRLLKAQLCLLTAECVFHLTNHLIGQEKGSGPVLYGSRFLLGGGRNPKDDQKPPNPVFADDA